MRRLATALMTAALCFTFASPALAEESDLMRAMRRVSESTRKLTESEAKLVEARRRYEEKQRELVALARKVAETMRGHDEAPAPKAKPVLAPVRPIPGAFTAKPILRRPVAKPVVAKRAPAKRASAKKAGRLAALKRPSRLAALRASAEPGTSHSIYERLTFDKKPAPGVVDPSRALTSR